MFNKYRESLQSGNKIYRTTALTSFLSPFLMILGLIASKYEMIGDSINIIFILLSLLLSVLAFVFLIINLFKKTKPILIYFLLALSTFFLIPFIDTDKSYYKITNELSSPTADTEITFAGELIQEGSIEINGRKTELTGNIWKLNMPLSLGINQFSLSFKTSSGNEKFKKSIEIERITPEELALRKQREAEEILAKKKRQKMKKNE